LASVKHPAYQPQSTSVLEFCDAAIIKVDLPFIFNDFVKKVKLPPHDYRPKGKALKQNRYSGRRLMA
jgi:hypothetical protein